ncbi:MAG: carboxypeptidase-like regulatory domain-containing protein, partial [Muribaculaceae bacterium]|nr:carboxypeptidase-like regulatory domain-containing protein [Muribaculaceae bacterium]
KQEIKVDTTIFMREFKELQELLVRPQKEKYSKKNNPAVELMRRVREYQNNGDPRLQDHYSYDQYDKITLGLLDIPESELEKHPFLREHVDSSRHGAQTVLNVLMKEKASTALYSDGSKSPKTVVRGRTSVGIDESFDDGNIGVMLEEFLREVDIYDDDVTIMANRFVSPLSALGADYYKYYITDTLDIDGVRCVQLTFSPRNPESFSFMGNLYVELGDTTGFIKKVTMKVPRTINLNYVDNLFIDQVYEKDDKGKRHKVLDEMNLDICIVPGTQRFYGRRVSRYVNFSDKKRMDLTKAYDMLGNIVEIDERNNLSGDFWTTRRLEPLTDAEANIGTFMGKLRNIPFFYWGERVLAIIVNGYVKTGQPSKFDIGPINTLISYSSLEGVRFRLGGMTTANLSPNLFGRGFVAYGTRDRKWKYKAELEYSFVKKKYHSMEF